ncbi:MAG: hypothetical protein QXF61_07000 [Nitrososphaeria archaeon]
MNYHKSIFLGLLLLLAFIPILSANLKGSLNRYSITILKLSEATIEEGHYQIYRFNDYQSYLAKEIDFRSEWVAAPITLTALSLVTGATPFAIKAAPFGVLMIPIALLLTKCFKLGRYQIIAYGILVGFSTMMINNNDYSQFLLGYLTLFVTIFLWAQTVFNPCDLRRKRILILLSFLSFYITLEYYYTSAFLFLIFMTSTEFTLFLQKKFNASSLNNVRSHIHLVITLWVIFLTKITLLSFFFSYYFGHSRNFFEIFSSSIFRLLNIFSSLSTQETKNVAEMYPRILNFNLLLTNTLVISIIVFSILVWFIWGCARKYPWLYIGIGIISTSIIEYIAYLFAGHLGIYSLLTRTFMLFGLLLSLHIIRIFFKRGKIGKIMAILLSSLLFIGQIGGWIIRLGDEKVYQAGPDIGNYQIHAPICIFSTASSKNGQKILTTHDLQFLVMAFGDINRTQDISNFGKYANILDNSHTPLPLGTIIVFTRLFSSLKPLFVTQDILKSPSEKYILNLESSVYLNKVYDDGVGVMFYGNK